MPRGPPRYDRDGAMTQPKFAPIMEQHEVREVAAHRRPRRPGRRIVRARAVPRPQPRTAAGLGVPGPDQGYALELATRFEDRLVLERESAPRTSSPAPSRSRCAGPRSSAGRRSPRTSSSPSACSGTSLGDEGRPPPSDLVALRRERFAGAAHDYWRRRALADEVPEATLRLSPTSPRRRLGQRTWSLAGARRRLTMAAFDLSEEQDEFRSVLRRLCEEKIAPRAAEYDENEAFPWESFHDCVAMELPALGRAERVRRRRCRPRDPGRHDRGGGTRLRLDERDAPHLQARDDPGHQLRERGAEAPLPAAGRVR